MNSSQTETNEIKDHFLGDFKKLSLFFRQRRHILDNPESVLVPDSARFPNGPLAFALIALSASHLLMAPISFVASNFVGLPPSALDNLIARLKSGNLAPESYRFSVDFLEHIAKEGTFVRNFRLAIAAISVYFAGSLFQWFLRKRIGTTRSESIYLYRGRSLVLGQPCHGNVLFYRSESSSARRAYSCSSRSKIPGTGCSETGATTRMADRSLSPWPLSRKCSDLKHTAFCPRKLNSQS
jgi:hypothetical protein